MEQFSLLILFVAIVVIWFWAWAPWKKRRDNPPQPGDQPDDQAPRR